MKDRIKELAETCYEVGVMDKDGMFEYVQFNERKFAELLLADVYDILHSYRARVIFLDGFEHNCVHPVFAIEKHFNTQIDNNFITKT